MDRRQLKALMEGYTPAVDGQRLGKGERREITERGTVDKTQTVTVVQITRQVFVTVASVAL